MWTNLLLNKKNLKTRKDKPNSLYFSNPDKFNIVTGQLVIMEIH